MSEIVLFTGAGASVPLGLATTSDFFGSPKGFTKWNPSYPDVFNSIDKIVGRKADAEEALALLEPAADYFRTLSGRFSTDLISRVAKGADKTAQFIAASYEQVWKRCFDLYGNEPDRKRVKELYWPLIDTCDWNTDIIRVFTTNYDLSIDVICRLAHEQGMETCDGFDKFGEFDPALYENQERGIAAYRLHGSMSYIEENGIVKRNNVVVPTGRDHLFLLPGFTKGAEKIEGNNIYRHPHASLIEALDIAVWFIVIGFSFRDPYLNGIFQTALEKNGNLQILLVNPEEPVADESGWLELKERYSSRVQHGSAKFGEGEVPKRIVQWRGGSSF